MKALKTPLRDVTPAPFDALAKVKVEGEDEGFGLREDGGGGEGENGHRRELSRGLMLSPEKAGEKRRKFVRYASFLFD